MIGIGLDCGSSESALAWIEYSARGYSVRKYLKAPNAVIAILLAEIIRDHHDIDVIVVGIEYINVAFKASSWLVQNLIMTARIEGDLGRLASDAGAIVRPIPAREVRGEICRSATASDAQIKIAVDGLLVVPLVGKAKDLVHVRDAIAVGIVALAREEKRAIVLPTEVARALHERQSVEQGRKTAKMRRKREAKKADSAVIQNLGPWSMSPPVLPLTAKKKTKKARAA